ncbi:MAG TPA: hypothetical protein VLA79_00395 [Polyangia bacterium]|nr:hypothetical protein [Polyangia bacterium]
MTTGRVLLALALLGPLGCSTKDNNNGFLQPTGGGGSGGAGGTTPNGKVEVTITAPAGQATVSQNSGLQVSATVDDDGSDFIDTTSVTAVLTTGGSTTPLAVGQLVSSGTDSYTGTLSIGALPSGTYTLTVSAASSGGATGQAVVSIMVTGGPTLIVNSPVEGKAYNGSLTIEILVDPGASPPTATLAGVPVALSLASSSSMYDTYRATIAFGPSTPPPAPVLTFPPLSGVQLLDAIESNGNATSEVKRIFTIDTTGPTISNTFPAPGDIIGGVVSISATVSDESGVLPSSVIAVIGDESGNPAFTLNLALDPTGAYSTLFDTANLTGCQPPPATSLCIVYPTISFRAVDLVGNQTTVGYDFAVDNVAPVADLDPPQMRGRRLGVDGYECSFAFDPLSLNRFVGDMPNDGCMVPQVFDLRARIEDDGNRAVGLKVIPIAGVDPDNTNVYVWHVVDPSDPNAPPLAVDTDGDGTCDAINPLLVPTSTPPTQSNQVLQIRLAGVPPAGSADFRPDSTLPANAPCGQGTATAPPKALCVTSQPTIAIGYADNSPAIWSVEPIDPMARCLGNQFDALANNIPEGWACIAVATADMAGSKSVSAPIRVYIQYDDPAGFCAAPPSSAGAPPTCTGTFDPTTNTAALGSCQARTFPASEYYCASGGC